MRRLPDSSSDFGPSAGENPVLTLGNLQIIALDHEARLYVGPRPWKEGSSGSGAAESIGSLVKDAAITAIVDLNADETEERAAKDGGLTYRGIHVTDDGKPLSPSILDSASRAVEELLDSGHRVYLHCTFGRGRSPTVAAAYLIASRGMSALAARAWIEELDAKWLHRGIWTDYDARFPGRLEEFEQWVRGETNHRD